MSAPLSVSDAGVSHSASAVVDSVPPQTSATSSVLTDGATDTMSNQAEAKPDNPRPSSLSRRRSLKRNNSVLNREENKEAKTEEGGYEW